jgi:hypothetical protein
MLTACVPAAGNGFNNQGDGESIDLLPDPSLKPDPDTDPGGTQAEA